MTRAYAEGTSVTAEKSRAELDTLLSKHGATQRAIMADDENEAAAVLFVLRERKYRLDIPMPKRSTLPDPTKSDYNQGKGIDTPRGWARMGVEQRKAWVNRDIDQRCRERWRAVVLLVKAKLELVRLGISTVEREFLSDLVLPNGRTVAATLEAQMREVLSGTSPRLLTE